MVYTCAYWKDATTLAEAQEAKLDLVCRKVGLEPGMRVLDLGCGWGGFAAYAAEKYGCTVVGVTLSKDQVALGREMWKHLAVDLRLCDYRDVTGTFDRVVVDRHDGARRAEEPPRRDGGGPPLPGRRRRRARPHHRQQPQPPPRHAVRREVHLPERGRAVARAARPRDRGAVRARGPAQHRPGLRPDADGVVGELRPRLPRAEGASTTSASTGCGSSTCSRPPARRARATASSTTSC